MVSILNETSSLALKSPQGLASTLFFRVYSGPKAIAFAQLCSRTPNKHRRALDTAALQPSGVSYCLRNIEVAQNYRNQGIGSALLQEIIEFCKDEGVSNLYGEAKGDTAVLQRWYRAQGFDLDSAHNIQLSFTPDRTRQSVA